MSIDNQKWADLGFKDKTKMSLSIFLIISSVVLGFLSFILLQTIPNSVIAQSGVYLSGGLAILGISQWFSTELVKMRTIVNEKVREIDNLEHKMRKEMKDDEERDLETDS